MANSDSESSCYDEATDYQLEDDNKIIIFNSFIASLHIAKGI